MTGDPKPWEPYVLTLGIPILVSPFDISLKNCATISSSTAKMFEYLPLAAGRLPSKGCSPEAFETLAIGSGVALTYKIVSSPCSVWVTRGLSKIPLLCLSVPLSGKSFLLAGPSTWTTFATGPLLETSVSLTSCFSLEISSDRRKEESELWMIDSRGGFPNFGFLMILENTTWYIIYD